MSDRRPGSDPVFSVVIPAYNEGEFIARTLASLQAQDFDGPFEVIVVDNNSTDDTGEVARAAGAIVVREERRGVCWARQRGTEVARGEFVVSTDADTVHPRDWLTRVYAQFQSDTDVVAVGGPCRFTNAPRWALLYPTLLFGAVAFLARWTRRVLYVTATNTAFRRSAFTGYDTSCHQGGDELGLLARLRKQGRIVFDKDNVVMTSARRLQQGLIYNLFVTFLFYYVLGYAVNKVMARPVLGNAPAFRERTPTERKRRAITYGISLAACAVLLWAWA